MKGWRFEIDWLLLIFTSLKESFEAIRPLLAAVPPLIGKKRDIDFEAKSTITEKRLLSQR
jgi:hypothetical protein